LTPRRGAAILDFMQMRSAMGLGLAAVLLAAGGCGSSSSTGGSTAGMGGSSNASTGTGKASGSGSMGTGGAPSSSSGNFNPTLSGSGGSAGGTNCGNVLQAMIRDFSPTTHPDFESMSGDDKGIVKPDVGADQKPVYAGNPTTPTTSGKTYFDQWYNDTPGINLPIPLDITLTPGAGNVYTYDNQAFFPIDGQGFGNEGRPHNYHFTLELHTQFQYKGGEVFTFIGDDDIFTFINGKLAINLGGVHGAETGSVDLDAKAAELGITTGNSYPIDLFFAERHTVDSHFRIDTTIGCFTPPPPH
jgi:fibro-slime domain-containing protein